MEFWDVIEKRRSVRLYEDTSVDDSFINQIIICGHKAPSAGNIQPWEFIVVKDKTTKRQIVDTTYVSNNYESPTRQEWLMNAPVFIVVVVNKEKSFQKYGEKALRTLIYLDCSACIENMILAAINIGLATCYISGFRETELSRVLDLPKNYETIGFISLGYQKGTAVIKPKSDLNIKIHYERFSKSV